MVGIIRKVCLFAAIIAVAVAGCASPTGNARRAKDFVGQFKRAVNPDELQAWATNLISKTPPPKLGPADEMAIATGINQADTPAYIRGFYNNDPPEVYVCYGGPCISIWYDSHHCGLWIGNSALRLKSSEFHDRVRVIPWKAGMYFGAGDFGR